jgi:hypothetical protein
LLRCGTGTGLLQTPRCGFFLLSLSILTDIAANI